MAITLGDLIVRIRGDQKDLDRDLSEAESKTEKSAGRMAGFFSGALQHAVGGAILGGVQTIGNAILGGVGAGFEAVKSYESMTASLNTLLAKEIQQNSVVEKRILVGHKDVQVMEGAAAANLKKGETEEELAFKIQKTSNSIAVANERLNEAIAKGKESAAEIEARKLRIQNMEQSLAALTARQGQEGTAVTRNVAIYETEVSTAMDIVEARKLAAEKSKELLDWSQKLAINSPFSQEDVVKGMRTAMALGYNSEMAQRLTTANINMAAAMGGSGEMMSRVSLALGQMQAKGRLMGGEMLQLTEAGIPMREMLIESGKVAGLTAENFDKMQEKGLIPAKAAYEAYVEYAEKNFATAAADQANTLAGLENSWADLKSVILRVGLEPMFKAIQPYLVQFVTMLQDPAIQANVAAIGQALGTFVVGALDKIFKLIQAFGAGGAGGLMAALGIGPQQQTMIIGVVTSVQAILQSLVTWFITNWPAIQAINEQVLGAVITVLQSLGDWWAVNGPGIMATAQALFEGIVTAAQLVATWVAANWPAIQATITDVFTAIKFAVDTWVVPMLQFLVAEFGKVVGWLQENWPLIQQTTTTVFTAIRNIANAVIPPLVTLIGGAFASIKAAISTTMDVVLGIIRAAMLALNGDWEGAWNQVKATLARVWDGILEFMRGFPKALVEIGKSIIDGLIKGIEAKAEDFKNALLNTLPPAIREVLKAMGIASPSRVMMRIGNQIMDGLILPIEQRSGELADRLAGAAGAFAGYAGAQLPQLASAAQPALAAAAGAGAGSNVTGGSSITINISGVTINKDSDIDQLAWRLARRIQEY